MPEQWELEMHTISHSLSEIASVLTLWVKIQEERFRREYPERTVREAIVGTAEYKTPNPEEEPQTEDIEPWIGPREKNLNAQVSPATKRSPRKIGHR